MTIPGAGFDFVLKGGRVIDERNGVDGPFDVAVKAGKIAAVGADVDPAGVAVRDVKGCIVTPGLIDIHTHVYHKATSLSVDPGLVARRAAITTLVDAGSAGAGNYDGLRDYVMAHSPYRILAFLNISFPGIFGFDKDVQIGEATARAMLPVHRCGSAASSPATLALAPSSLRSRLQKRSASR
jgi:dihydroorotase